MTGPEHYRAAEHLVAMAAELEAGSASDRSAMAEAQVHATLALAAATALAANEVLPAKDEDEWMQAVSLYSRGEQP